MPTLSPRFPGLPCRRPTLLSRVCITPPTGSTRLASATLYLCTDARRERGDLAEFADAALAGGVDIIQLRDKGSAGEQRFGPLEARDELAALEVLADAARRHDALLAVNDRADIARAAGADVLHLGQDDLPLPIARDIVGPQTLIGRSTHDARSGRRRGCRSRWTTSASARAGRRPTKPGRPAPVSTWSASGRIGRDGQAVVRDRRHRRSSGCPRCSTRVRAASSWCGRSRRPTIRAPRASRLKARLAAAG